MTKPETNTHRHWDSEKQEWIYPGVHLRIGKYALSPITVPVGVTPPFGNEQHIWIENTETGEGMSTREGFLAEYIDAFFQENM